MLTKQDKNIKSFADLIDRWPDRSALAEDLGVRRNLVDTWHSRSRRFDSIIEPCHWNGIVASARARRVRGITLHLLADLAEAHGPARG